MVINISKNSHTMTEAMADVFTHICWICGY